MGIFNFFKKNRKVKTKQDGRKTKPYSGKKDVIEKIEADVERFQAQLNTVNIALSIHNNELAEHTRLIKEHTKGLESLEQKLNAVSIRSPPEAEPTPPISVIASYPPKAIKSTTPESPQKLDINRFSEQEKRILAVFFQNKGNRLSYEDVAKMLRKSAHTIKNQIRQIRQKADLFDRTIGNQNRNLFKLKDNLRIEKYLNVGQSIERPMSTTWTMQSNNKE